MTTVTTYDCLAGEYYDPIAHPTCYNLNRLSRLYIEEHLPEPWNSRKAIEVGAGDSSVAPILHARGHSLQGLEITDASREMLRHSARWAALGAAVHLCDAHEVGKGTHLTSLIVAGLGDSYNTPLFWAAVERALSPEGLAIFTIPSFAWSSRFRGTDCEAAHVAEFLLKDGRRVLVPSHVMSLSEQVHMMEHAGLMVTDYESFGVERFGPDEVRSPKIDVFGGGVSSLIWGFVLVHQKAFSG